MKRAIIIWTLVAIQSISMAKAQDTLMYWGFNESSGTVALESINNAPFQIYSKWPLIERVQGVRQMALRTDGYTVYAAGNINVALPADSFSATAWIAPDTYPVNTAAIWADYDPVNNRGAFIAMNRFGNLVVGFNAGGQQLEFSSTAQIAHGQWSYIAANVDATHGNVIAYLNGVAVINQHFSTGTLSWPAGGKIYLGRSALNESQGIFPLNYLNGIYDEIIIRKSLLTETAIAAEYNRLKPLTPPDLSVPLSRFSNDFHRPRYHPIPKAGWANESHGLLYYKGIYHMFYQKNGNGPYFSQQNWGHLTSTDLIRWKETQVALWPQQGFEQVGIWSGHCIKDDSGTPTIFYTGVDGVKAAIGSAKSTDDLLYWNRNPANPVIPHSPDAYPNRDFRDPYVFKEGADWYMITGSGLQSPQTGTVFLYKSADLTAWQLIGPLFIDQSYSNDPGIFWEMPVFWKFGPQYLLLVNKTPDAGTPARSFYWVGDFSAGKFIPKNQHAINLELINSLLSPTVNLDDQNRVVAIGIIPDLLPPSEQYNNGWANVFSLPREWKLINDTLYQSPHPYLNQLRGQVTSANNLTIHPDGKNYLNTRGLQLELKATIQPGNASKVGFILEKNDANTEFTKIYYDYVGQKMVVDRTNSSINPNVPRDMQSESFAMPAGNAIDWHIYIDGSVVEVFINDKWTFSTRIYPSDRNSDIVEVFSEGSDANVSAIQTWKIGDIVTALPNEPATITAPRSLTVRPVPANEYCYIDLPPNAVGSLDMQIYNLNGGLVKVIHKQVFHHEQIKWDLTSNGGNKQPPGMYFCTIRINKKEYYVSTILIMN